MTETLLALGSAFGLGVWTSVSPCPLTTNIAAVTFVARRLANPRDVLFAGVLYTAGRTLVYASLGSLLVFSLLSASQVSMGLQRHMNALIGPILVLAGMVMLGLLPLRFPSFGPGGAAHETPRAPGPWGAGALGILFALSFCPISAALFFGTLVPLAISRRSAFLLPAAYGVGTAVPVIAFALAVALGVRSISAAFRRIVAIERHARIVAGVAFVIAGVYLTLVHVFRVMR